MTCRCITNQVALFMQSSAQATKAGSGNSSGANAPAQPVLAFQWGTYDFKGIMESFKETIDFFSADGVPLRALVSIGLARQDNVFDEDQALLGTDTGAGSLVPTSSGDSATRLPPKAAIRRHRARWRAPTAWRICDSPEELRCRSMRGFSSMPRRDLPPALRWEAGFPRAAASGWAPVRRQAPASGWAAVLPPASDSRRVRE